MNPATGSVIGESSRYLQPLSAEDSVFALMPNRTGQLPLGEIKIELDLKSRDMKVFGSESNSANLERST